MANAVWKYPIKLTTDVIAIDMPCGAAILTVQMQGNEPMVWVLVDEDADLSMRTFRIAGTGHPITEDIEQYIGTYQMYGGSLVFHLFEVNL